MKMPRDVHDCWAIASAEAERYQELINKERRANGVTPGMHDRLKLLTAKRDAASRIARLIKYGQVENGGDK